MPFVFLRAVGIVVALFALQVALAQDSARHSLELSAIGRQTANEVTFIYGLPNGPIRDVHEQIFGGGLVGYSFALSPNFALETRAGYLFGRQPQVPQDGGEQVLAHVGIRATVPIAHSRYAVRARIAPGISSFSSGLRSQDLTLVQLDPSGIYGYTSMPQYGRITHFSLEESVGLSAKLSPRMSLTFDVSHETLLTGDRSQVLPGTNSTIVLEPASVEDHALVSVGLSRSFGHAFAPAEQMHTRNDSASTPPNELVISYALQPTVHLAANDLGLDPGFAITGSHFLRPWLALDSSVILLRGGDTPTFQDGGADLQFFAGIKVGVQRSRYGMFVKIRPGFISFTHALANSSTVPPPPGIADQYGGDFGAVLEAYPAHHMVLRFDLGETLIHYSAVAPLDSYGSNYYAGGYASAPQFLLGAGWRF